MKSVVDIFMVRIIDYSCLLNKLNAIEKGYLTSLEQIRLTSFFRIEDKINFILWRYLVRNFLEFPIIDFTFWKHWKPYLANSVKSFNISHTDGMVVVSTSADNINVWVDVESNNVELFNDLDANLFLHPNEYFILNPLQIKELIHIWVVKEAYLKACWDGITEWLSSLDTWFLLKNYANLFLNIWNFHLSCIALEIPERIKFKFKEVDIEKIL